jgi:hypothetical protein
MSNEASESSDGTTFNEASQSDGIPHAISHSKSTDELLEGSPKDNMKQEIAPVSTCTSFFCGQYEAPEARPWVFMHCVVGICVIHYSIAISQEILYTAGSIADANQRLPTLFYIRAGNAQTAVNVMVSIINFVFLPTIGAVCDYTRFRYHMGSAALCLVCVTEFVSAAPSQNVIIYFNCRIHLWFTTVFVY